MEERGKSSVTATCHANSVWMTVVHSAAHDWHLHPSLLETGYVMQCVALSRSTPLNLLSPFPSPPSPPPVEMVYHVMLCVVTSQLAPPPPPPPQLSLLSLRLFTTLQCWYALCGTH